MDIVSLQKEEKSSANRRYFGIIFTLFAYMIFFPSVTFSIYKAEIFPWAIIFVLIFAKKINKEFIFIFLFFLLSSIYGYYLSSGTSIFQAIRSMAAYFNPLLIFVFLLNADESLLNKLIPKIKVLFYFLIILGLLQRFGIIDFTNSFIKFFIPRASAESFGLQRGVTLLSSEPSRASYVFIFIYVSFRTIFLEKKQYLKWDIISLLFVLFILKSGTGLIIFSVFLLLYYRLKFLILLLVAVVISVPFLHYLNGRAFDLLFAMLSKNSIGDLYKFILSASGFRLVSIISSFYYGIVHPFGGGVGNWELSSIQAFKLSGISPSSLTFFKDFGNSNWIAVRPTSYISALMLDTGIVGTIISLYYILKIPIKHYLFNRESKNILLLFLFYLLFVGSVGNPVPFVTTVLTLRFLKDVRFNK